MNEKSVKQRLRSGERLNGCWIETFNPIAAEIMALSGYDTAMIDLEHGPGSYLDAISMMQAVNQYQCTPLIRTSCADPAVIKRVLDIGPGGVMVPNIRSVDEAQEVVAACRYGPAGIRGAAPTIIRGAEYGKEGGDYLRWIDEEFLLIGQVESRQAVEQIEAIAEIEGLDMLFIGPADLSASLGALGGFDRDEFICAFETIEQTTLKAGKLLGTIPFGPWSAKRLYENGHSLVLSGADTVLLRQAAEQDVASLRQASV